jgi:cell filamentation protein
MDKMQPTNPFTGKLIRCLFEKSSNKWWFSAVDICAALTDDAYDDSRRYWNLLKHRIVLRKNQLIAKCNQLKLPGAYGKPAPGRRYTKVQKYLPSTRQKRPWDPVPHPANLINGSNFKFLPRF